MHSGQLSLQIQMQRLRACRNCGLPYLDHPDNWPHHCSDSCRAQHLGLIPPWLARDLTAEEEERLYELGNPRNPELMRIYEELPVA